MTDPVPRRTAPADLDPLADLFDRLWHVAHSGHVPPELEALRTRPDFLRRLLGFGDGLRVIGPVGKPQGFAAVVGNHLDQLYVAQQLWGTGAARVLMDDALARIAAAGHRTAVLECNVHNLRAAAMYRKSGWTERGVERVMLDSAAGPFGLDCLVFDRAL